MADLTWREEHTMTRAFVAGATGYTGREVVRRLAERGVEVIAHVRPDSSRLDEWRERFSAMGASGDSTPWTLEAMTERLTQLQPDVIFALLGTTRKRAKAAAAAGHAAADYEAVDYGLSAMLIEAARAAGLTPKLVYLSSMGVTEGTKNAYLQVRWRVEDALTRSGFPYVIARPSFITGPDREENRPLERVGAAMADGALSLLGGLGARRLRDRYRSTDSARLATALVELALDEEVSASVVESDALHRLGG